MTAPLPPGWYPDPGGANTQRYFDGTKWGPLWVGAATVAAAEMPELQEYAAGCGQVLKIYVGGYTKDEVMAIIAAETIGKTPKMLARMGRRRTA
jgi:hypothetical protein